MAKAKIEVKCANPQCGKYFTTTQLDKTCCNSACYRVFRESTGEKHEDNCKTRVTKGTIGATHELIVGADLLKRGYGVFRSLSQTCPCDLILMIDKDLFRIEVRTGSRSADGRLQFPFTAKDVGRSDILAIVESNWNVTYYNKKQEVIDFAKIKRCGKARV